MASTWYDIEEILPAVIRVNDGDLDTSYILRGATRTGVIDTGLGVGDLAAVVARVSPAPPLVINTHAHPDHWSGNHQFAETSMSAPEWAMARGWWEAWNRRQPDPNEATPLDLMKPKRPFPPEFDRATYQSDRVSPPTQLWADGDVIDLGGFRLEVIVAPAHTPGSMCLLERQRRFMLTGDTILPGSIWLQLEESVPYAEAFQTYERLATYADLVDYVLPAHSTQVLPSAILTAFAQHTRRILAGEVEPRFHETFAGNGWHYPAEGFGLLIRDKVEPRR